MEGKCIYRSKDCIGKVNTVGHEGTELKFEAFAKYAVAWINKMIMFTKKNGDNYQILNYIDCMASSGLYVNEDKTKFIDGTTIRIINIFKGTARKYPDKEFNIYLNDYENQYVKCLKCIKNEYENRGEIPENLNIEITELDKNKFIEQNLSSSKFKKYEAANLIVYDPYEVDFDWKVLRNMFKLNADFLITHFFPNDTKRSLSVVKSEEKKQRYAKSYNIDFDELLKTYLSKTTVYERNIYLRQLFVEQLLLNSNKKFTCYAPVFADLKKLHVYDIVCLSHSTYSLELLKRTMYTLYSKKSEEAVHKMASEQISLFEDVESDRYQSRREAGISEFNFHYNNREILKQFIETFKGKELTDREFKKILRTHPYLPPQILTMVKNSWKYTTKKDKYKDTSIYYFPKGGLYE